MTIKIISWNIAGAHTVASDAHFDYNPENIPYFTEEIEKFAPDIICLQEAHTSYDNKVSNAEQIANNLNYEFVLNSPVSPSHVDPKYQLSTAIISKLKFNDTVVETFPDPETTLYWKDGREADTHHKNIQQVKIDDFYIANNQMLPISLFGYTYDDTSYGGKLAHGINSTMERIIKTPLIWCGDFNFNAPLGLYPYMKTLRLTEALPDEATRPSKDGAKKTPDHIFFTPEFKLIHSEIVKTNTDHYLCFAEFQY